MMGVYFRICLSFLVLCICKGCTSNTNSFFEGRWKIDSLFINSNDTGWAYIVTGWAMSGDTSLVVEFKNDTAFVNSNSQQDTVLYKLQNKQFITLHPAADTMNYSRISKGMLQLSYKDGTAIYLQRK